MELAENFCQNNQEIIQRIYEKIYKQFNTGVIDVFLCGGTDKISIRNTLRLYLLKNKGRRVLYPEDLFLELLNINKEYNLFLQAFYMSLLTNKELIHVNNGKTEYKEYLPDIFNSIIEF